MAAVEFVDSRGVHWRVWSTVPAADSPLSRYYPEGWLTFDAGTKTLRRLSPVPRGWEHAATERLELMCRAAQEVPRHTGEMMKVPRPTEGPLAERNPDAGAGAPSEDSSADEPSVGA